MDATVKEKILLGIMLLAASISPVYVFIQSEPFSRVSENDLLSEDSCDANPDLNHSSGGADMPAPPRTENILSQVSKLNAAGESAKSLELLDDANLKNSAQDDSRVKDAYLTTYDLYTADQIRQGDFNEAIRILKNKIDIDTGHADEINTMILDTYFLRIERDRSKHFYKEALETINLILPDYAKYDTGHKIQKETEAVYYGLSRDTGIDGQHALLDAITPVCLAAHPPRTGVFVYLGTDTTYRKLVDCSKQLPLEPGLTPQTIAEFAYAIRVHVVNTRLPRCSLNDGNKINHIREDWTVTVTDAGTGEIIETKKFPATVTACPVSQTKSQTGDALIDSPREEDVMEYVRTFVK